MIDVKQEVKKIESEIIEWRHQLHMIPEIHTELPQTTAFIKARLEEMGLTYKTYTNNGISAVIEGAVGSTFAYFTVKASILTCAVIL